MLAMYSWFRARWNEETGASLVEYALLLVLIAVVAIAAITLGNEVDTTFSEIGSGLQNA